MKIGDIVRVNTKGVRYYGHGQDLEAIKNPGDVGYNTNSDWCRATMALGEIVEFLVDVISDNSNPCKVLDFRTDVNGKRMEHCFKTGTIALATYIIDLDPLVQEFQQQSV